MKSSGGGRPNRITIRDVAADADVSVAAVSKVLREAYGVSASMRSKVHSSMAKLGYRPHTAARGMRGQTFTLGLILPDIRNPFFADIIAGFQDGLEGTQYQALIGINRSTSMVEEGLVDSMIDRQMDGLLIVGANDHEQLIAIAQRKPLVTIGNHHASNEVYDTVNNDDDEAARLAVRHLVDGGYRNIAMLSLITDSTIIKERERGYTDEMNRLGLSRFARIVRSDQLQSSVQNAARAILTGPDRTEALFCWTDFIALQVIGVATELGLGIPDDVAIVGHDNTMYCDFGQNSLTSVDQSGRLLGLEAARRLIERIKGRQATEHYLVSPRLVVRRSSVRNILTEPAAAL
ncbi:LacI family transcriptional regulator [Mesorhizobium sp. BR1-1-16]|uniref:LacI family DNA-binding transcriptional regulator n=1 Tax=Mesorhizobium sp. BR1-1-16 TaxID=2876653 RepID=UPI001CCA8815|nr:LacI family DNA-binding transcriptional regulator [Mesorhizobium sp. BR1-1-16]MBZ9936834.1 LacI family transcriptional regulator [Mesorhizobium sp. BR1-1-16]